MVQSTLPATTEMVLHEVTHSLASVDAAEAQRAVDLLLAAPRIFVTGAGRSGLALRMAAMRLMHLGMTVFVVGDATTPAIARGDLLLVASASGTTAGPLHAVQTARKAGAEVLLVTTRADSPMAREAKACLTIAATTRQQAGNSSAQYAGALFEQSVLLLTDILFHQMWQRSGKSADDLSSRHANLE